MVGAHGEPSFGRAGLPAATPVADPDCGVEVVATSGVPVQVTQLATSLVRPVADGCAVIIIDAGGAVRDVVAIHVIDGLGHAVRALGEAIAQSMRASLRRLLGSVHPFVLRPGDDAFLDPVVRTAADAVGARSVAIVPMPRHASGFVMLISARPDHWRPLDTASLRATAASVAATFAGNDACTEAEDLMADIHHDLGNPLQAICLRLDALLSMGPEHDGRPALEQLRQTARRLTNLLGQLHGYLHGRNDPGEATTARVRCAIDEVIASLAPLAAQRSIRLGGGDIADAVVEISPLELFRVLSNLVGNAIKYADACALVRISAHVGDDRVRITVDDSGPGMSAADCARLFDRDWLAASTLRKGTGLGLAIAKRLVEAHGGSIHISSTQGEGTRCIVDLVRSASEGAKRGDGEAFG
jgi:signal transduction histidine kinase